MIIKAKRMRQKSRAAARKNQTQITFSSVPNDTILQKVIFSDLKMTVLLATQNISLTFHNTLSLNHSPGFPNSQIVLKYHSASPKVTCMLNKSLATFPLEDLTSAMKHQPFSICIHSADIYLFKFNNGNTKVICEIFSELTIKTPERRLNK